MIEAIAEHDDELMAAWVAGRELAAERSAPRCAASRSRNRGVPTLVGAAFQQPGHPQPARRGARLPAVAGRPRRDARPRSRRSDRRADAGPRARRRPAARGARVQGPDDDAGGQLTFVRVYAGCLRVGDTVLDATKGHLEHIGRLVRMFANHREDIRQIEAGMIGAIVAGGAPSELATGDTLCDPRSPILLDPITVPERRDGRRRRARDRRGSREAARALERLAIEDPSFRVQDRRRLRPDRDLGMGELHLDIVVDRLRREFGVQARVGNPQVAYRETVTRRAEGENRFVRQLGPRGEYGHVRLVVEPTDRGGGYVYENRASAATSPRSTPPRSRRESPRPSSVACSLATR